MFLAVYQNNDDDLNQHLIREKSQICQTDHYTLLELRSAIKMTMLTKVTTYSTGHTFLFI